MNLNDTLRILGLSLPLGALALTTPTAFAGQDQGQPGLGQDRGAERERPGRTDERRLEERYGQQQREDRDRPGQRSQTYGQERHGQEREGQDRPGQRSQTYGEERQRRPEGQPPSRAGQGERGRAQGMEQSQQAGRRPGRRAEMKKDGKKAQYAENGQMAKMTRFSKLDADGDGMLDEREIRSGVGPLFDNWDFDENDELVDLEIVHGLFSAWDVDGDDEIDKIEFERGKAIWLPDDASVFYEDFDEDGDHEVTLVDFTQGFYTKNIAVYDTDAEPSLTSAELADAMLAAYDEDRDGKLSKQEWPMD